MQTNSLRRTIKYYHESLYFSIVRSSVALAMPMSHRCVRGERCNRPQKSRIIRIKLVETLNIINARVQSRDTLMIKKLQRAFYGIDSEGHALSSMALHGRNLACVSEDGPVSSGLSTVPRVFILCGGLLIRVRNFPLTPALLFSCRHIKEETHEATHRVLLR